MATGSDTSTRTSTLDRSRGLSTKRRPRRCHPTRICGSYIARGKQRGDRLVIRADRNPAQLPADNRRVKVAVEPRALRARRVVKERAAGSRRPFGYACRSGFPCSTAWALRGLDAVGRQRSRGRGADRPDHVRSPTAASDRHGLGVRSSWFALEVRGVSNRNTSWTPVPIRLLGAVRDLLGDQVLSQRALLSINALTSRNAQRPKDKLHAAPGQAPGFGRCTGEARASDCYLDKICINRRPLQSTFSRRRERASSSH